MRGEKFRIGRTQQCAHCPWRKDSNRFEIPNGYSEEKHRNLEGTIAKPCDVSSLSSGTMRVMACHESHEDHCVGWLNHQLGRGNNIALRLQMMRCENIGDLKTVGEQHETFEDTLS